MVSLLVLAVGLGRAKCGKCWRCEVSNHVVMFSGGIGSWGAARRVADSYGTSNLLTDRRA